MDLMKKRLFFGFLLILVFVLFLSNSHASYIPVTVLGAPEGTVYSVSFSPDGSTLASGSGDNTIKLWEVATGQELKTLTGHRSWVHSVSFSPDGSTLASGGGDNTIKLWEVATGQELRTLTGHEDSVLSVSFSPDGSTLASGSGGWNATIRLWEVATGQELRTLTGHRGDVYSVSFSPDGATLASGSGDNTIKLWEVATGQELRTLTGHRGDVYSVSFSPDGSTLASGSGGWNATIRLWEVATGQELRTLTGHGSDVNSVSFSPDGSTLASGSGDNTIKLWEVATGQEIGTGHSSWGDILSVSFSPDGSTLASGSTDATIRLWEIPTTRVRIAPSPVESPAVGEQLVFTVNITGGQNVRGYGVDIGYNSGTLRYISHTRGDYLPGNVFPGPEILPTETTEIEDYWDADQKFVGFNVVSPGGVRSGDGILATITFEVVARRASALELSLLLSDSDGEALGYLSEDGRVIEPPWDVNGDGYVNISDLAIVASRFGQARESGADVNGDGVVNIEDLILVASAMPGTLAAPAGRLQALTPLTPTAVEGWIDQARGLNVTDATSQRGIAFLEQLLSALTPKETALLANYPNPFNPETWIPYHLATAADVALTIYDTQGVVVRQLDLGRQQAGFYTDRTKAAYWNGKNALGESVSSGVYFYHLSAGDYSQTRKMLILK